MSDDTCLPVARRRAVRRRGRPRPRRPAARRCSATASSGSRVLYSDRAAPSWPQPVLDALVDARTTCPRSSCPTARRAKTAAVAAACWEALGRARVHPLRRGRHRSAAAPPPTWAASSPPPGCAGSASCTSRRPCSAWSTPPSAARPASTPPRARTWSAPSTSRPACCATWPRCGRCRAPSWSPASARSSSAASSPTRRSSTWSRQPTRDDARRRTRRCCASWSSARSGSRSTSWSADLRETGGADGHPGREVLNYGHTMAHAIERAEDYTIRHGEAVALGCVYVAELAAAGRHARRPRSSSGTTPAFARVGLPTAYAGASFDDLHAAMRVDKKARGSQLRFVVLDRPRRAHRARGTVRGRPARRVRRPGGRPTMRREGARPQRTQPRAGSGAGSRRSTAPPPTPSWPSCARRGAAGWASTSRCGRPTTRASCSTGSTPPPTTTSRWCSTPPPGPTTPTRCSTPAPSSPRRWSRCTSPTRPSGPRSSGTRRWSRRTPPRSSPGTASTATGWRWNGSPAPA